MSEVAEHEPMIKDIDFLSGIPLKFTRSWPREDGSRFCDIYQGIVNKRDLELRIYPTKEKEVYGFDIGETTRGKAPAAVGNGKASKEIDDIVRQYIQRLERS